MVLGNENTKVLDFMWNIYSILGSVSTQRFGAEKSWPLLLQSRAEPHANPCCTQSNQVEAQRFVETGTIWGFLCLIYICNTRLNGGLGLLQFVPLSYKIIIIVCFFLIIIFYEKAGQLHWQNNFFCQHSVFGGEMPFEMRWFHAVITQNITT